MRHTLLLAVCLLWAGSLQLQAQKVGVWYDTELQIRPNGQTNHVNLLYLSTDFALSKHLQLNAATISIAKTRNESLLDDLQTFSNIEADNMPLSLALLGFGWSIGDHHSLFAGIRNVNEDYFTSPVTALFTNSSCGIFPTIGCNLPIANYPVASFGLHYAYTKQDFNLQASVYNGQGYDRLTGGSSVWRVSPQRDGLFLMTQADWTRGGSQYFVGGALHTGMRHDTSVKSVVWAYTEQTLTPHWALIADYSHAFGQGTECTDFAGFGLQFATHRSTVGLFTDYARFSHDHEWATELTCKYDLSPVVSLQASYHLIHHDAWQGVGLIRLSIRI